MHNSGELSRKRDAKAAAKHNTVSIENRHEASAGAFNFTSGSFKPKDNTEGTILSINRLRKRSLELPESQNTLERDINPNPMASTSKLVLNMMNNSLL